MTAAEIAEMKAALKAFRSEFAHPERNDELDDESRASYHNAMPAFEAALRHAVECEHWLPPKGAVKGQCADCVAIRAMLAEIQMA